MVIKEYRCAAHGYFESGEASPSCPKGGCTTVSQVFLTAPAFRSDKTKRADSNLRQIAIDFGLTDMRSAREGEAARIHTPAQKKAMEEQRKLQARFLGQVPKGGTFEVGKGVVGGGAGQGALAALAAHHAPETNVITQVKPMLGTQIQNRVVATRDGIPDSVARVKAA